MARIELTQSGVFFNEELHEYWLGDKQLSGITEALRKQLHPDMYSSIPKRILEQAAQYGTSVHKSIEEFQKNWINNGTQEVQDFIQICKDNSLIHESSEYTVSDGRNWAVVLAYLDKVLNLLCSVVYPILLKLFDTFMYRCSILSCLFQYSLRYRRIHIGVQLFS